MTGGNGNTEETARNLFLKFNNRSNEFRNILFLAGLSSLLFLYIKYNMANGKARRALLSMWKA